MMGRLASTSNPYPFRNKVHPKKFMPRKGMLPRTDDLLARAINISVGVSDPGLGSAFGIVITDTPKQIDRKAARFRKVLAETV